MKKRLCWVLVIILCGCLCSCNNKNIDEQVPPSKTEIGSINHGVIVPDPIESDFTLCYNDGEITLTYMLENGSSQNTWGFSIYLAGVRQPFSVDNGEETYMFISNFEPGERKDISVSFTPVVGQKGDLLPISFVVMVDPEYLLDNNISGVRYGAFHSITQMIWQIQINKETNNDSYSNLLYESKELDTKFISKYTVTDEFGNKVCLLDSNIYFELGDEKDTVDFYSVMEGEPLKLRIYAAGNNPIVNGNTLYRLSLYVDHTIVSCFDGKSYADILVEKDKLSYLELEIPYETVVGNNYVYLLAAPITQLDSDIGALPILKTETKPIVIVEGE